MAQARDHELRREEGWRPGFGSPQLQSTFHLTEINFNRMAATLSRVYEDKRCMEVERDFRTLLQAGSFVKGDSEKAGPSSTNLCGSWSSLCTPKVEGSEDPQECFSARGL